MVGTNVLELNEASMCEAVQYWLTNNVIHSNHSAPKVTSIGHRIDDHCPVFMVRLESSKP